ncbi:hypothetical protein ACOME3_010749 [Neoechinorhynchus agilis]
MLGSFVRCGLSNQKAEETLKNKNLSKVFYELITSVESRLNRELNEKDSPIGTLLYALASRLRPQIRDEDRWKLVDYICDGRFTKTDQVAAGIEFILQSDEIIAVNDEDFDLYCGVGVKVSQDDIKKAVNSTIADVRDQLITQGYNYPIGRLISKTKSLDRRLRWADGCALKAEVDRHILEVLGPRTDSKDRKATRKQLDDNASNLKLDPTEGLIVNFDFRSLMDQFHKPGENYKTDGYVTTSNTMNLIKEHLKRTKGQVITRFPPEPNGILHIGHAKSINFNFGFARQCKGITYLRFDDTNPEKEELKFFIGIIDMVRWLGYKPYKITYASDYFDRMYELAKDLIRRELAYVCHQNVDDLKGHQTLISPWRNRSSNESLVLFEQMKNGLFDEGEATLRMKYTMEDGKMDPVAYRIKYAHHARTGDKWCIYPTYDFTHCLNDSFEDISHSLCTKEFQSRRSAYYWLCTMS